MGRSHKGFSQVELLPILMLMAVPYVMVGVRMLVAIFWSIHALSGPFEFPLFGNRLLWLFMLSSANVEIIVILLLLAMPYVMVGVCLSAAIFRSIRTLSVRCKLPFFRNRVFWAFVWSSASVLCFLGFMLGVSSKVWFHIHRFGDEDLGGRVMLPILLSVLPLLAWSFVSWFGSLVAVLLLLVKRSPLRISFLAIMSYLLEIIATGFAFFWLYRFVAT
jgi:hypothetical protein